MNPKQNYLVNDRPVSMIDYLVAARAAVADNTGQDIDYIFMDANGTTANIKIDSTNVAISLPSAPNNMLSRQQADIYTGYWLHESLHALYTDGYMVNQVESHGNMELFNLWNGLEDCRVELKAD